MPNTYKIIKDNARRACWGDDCIKDTLTALYKRLCRMLRKEKDKEYFLTTITHADKELADIQAISMELGYNQYRKEVKAILKKEMMIEEKKWKHNLLDKEE